MAAKMVNIAKRGRVYQCGVCGHKEEKGRVEVHFYRHHVSSYEVPFLCTKCDYRTGDQGKFDRHLGCPSHVAGLDLLSLESTITVSPHPRYFVIETDAIKLDRESSRLYWISRTPSPAPPVVEDEDKETEPEDIFPQLMSDMEVDHTFPSPTCRESAVVAPVPEPVRQPPMAEVLAEMREVKSFLEGAKSANQEFVEVAKSIKTSVDTFVKTQTKTNHLLEDIYRTLRNRHTHRTSPSHETMRRSSSSTPSTTRPRHQSH